MQPEGGPLAASAPGTDVSLHPAAADDGGPHAQYAQFAQHGPGGPSGPGIPSGLRGARAHGVVLTRDGWPLPGASVTLLAVDGVGSARATSGSDGRFVLADLETGPATLLVACAGHEPQARSVVVQDPRATRAEEMVVDFGELRLARVGAAELPPPGRWVIDPDHTSLVATAHHLGLSAVNGRLSRLEGAIEVAEPFSGSSVQVRIDAASIDTGVAARDDHLRSADFLDVEHHPWITYEGRGLLPDGAGGWQLNGQLTLNGTARPVPLSLRCTGTGTDPWGGQRVAFQATAQLSRNDFAMKWNQAFGLGVAIFGTTLRITIDLEAVRET
ncbi:YceI family protein [Quadrisphaera granulorum]|uniref:YceI family protein n=1 Tax=Quadrisphaera granulorum TaxID=317664 RepID=UPI001B86CCAE|nr:YceI family protein [Quadrisphaera granulorum]